MYAKRWHAATTKGGDNATVPGEHGTTTADFESNDPATAIPKEYPVASACSDGVEALDELHRQGYAVVPLLCIWNVPLIPTEEGNTVALTS